MADRDDTNSGVIFPPYPEQSFMGSGKLNIEGKEHRAVVVLEQLSRDKPKVRVLYLRAGVLFDNTEGKAKNEKAPDFSGPLDEHEGYRVAAWKGEKDGKKYLSLRASQNERQSGTPGQADASNGWDDGRDAPPASNSRVTVGSSMPDDEIPF